MLELLWSYKPNKKILVILALVLLAGACNGLMDSIDHHPQKFDWLPEGSFKDWVLGDLQIGKGEWWMWGPVYVLQDGWHNVKQWMAFMFFSAIVVAIFKFDREDHGWFGPLMTYALLALAWGIGFTLFYNVLLTK
jgi:hypothetical protein